MPSIKRNILYSIVLSGSQYVVLLIVFPYASRILGPDRLGLVNFIDGTVEYFMVLSMLGISTLGIREIARNRSNAEALSRVFSSLLTLNFMSTLIACMALAVTCLCVESLRACPGLLAVGVLKLLFNFLLIEWLYRGLEEFRYITLRAVAVRLAFLAAIFIFVRSSDDYLWYYMAIVGAVVANAVINIICSRRYVMLTLKGLRLREFVRPFIILGCYAVLTAMYTSFNSMFLGMVSDDSQVAFYTTSTKIYAIIIAVFTAFTAVMVPRMSALLAEGQEGEFRTLVTRSYGALLAFAVPAVVFGLVMAPEIIYLVCGPGYEGAIAPLRIVMPLIFVIGYEQILVCQVLVPARQDHTILINSGIGAAMGVALNFLIVPRLAAVGSAIVWVACECSILILSQIAVSRHKQLRFPMMPMLKNVAVYAPMAAILAYVHLCVDDRYWSLGAGAAIMIVYAIAAQTAVLRNPEIMRFINRLRNRRSD